MMVRNKQSGLLSSQSQEHVVAMRSRRALTAIAQSVRRCVLQQNIRRKVHHVIWHAAKNDGALEILISLSCILTICKEIDRDVEHVQI